VLGKQLSARARVCLWLSVFTLSGCAATPTVSDDSQLSSPGAVVQSGSGTLLEPVALYGLPELSIGAESSTDQGEFITVCDRKFRQLDQDKPLVIYLDGDLQMLRWYQEQTSSQRLCHRFAASMSVIRGVADAQRAILRLYFRNGEQIEQRISGTMSDYLSRPKMLGPQRGFSRFIDAVVDVTPAEMVVVE